MTGPKRVSERQLAANRANALRSTGPKSPEGKAASARNALKHGILSKAVIPPALEKYESRHEYDALLASFVESLAPEGAVEEMLVERIATSYWRLGRLLRAEAADHPNAGYMIDTFHGYKAGLTAADIAGLRAEKLFIVHINDCEDLPREQLTDANRLYTGLGIIPLNDYLWSLKGLGYDGFLSVEIFREEYWRDTHENIIRNALEHLKATMAAVG